MIDQEIRDELKVDPSPEFLARVRTRIANEPAPSAWWSWRLVTAGAVAAALLIAVVVSRSGQKTAAPPEVVQASPPSRALGSDALQQGSPKLQGSGGGRQNEAIEAGPKGPTLQPNHRLQPTRSAEAFALRTTTSEPEILLDPAETRALRRLIAGARDGSVDLFALTRASTPTPMELPPMIEIAIAPIVIDPMTPPEGDQGAQQ